MSGFGNNVAEKDTTQVTASEACLWLDDFLLIYIFGGK